MFSVFVTNIISLKVLIIIIIIVCVKVVPVKWKSFVSCEVFGSGEGGKKRGKGPTRADETWMTTQLSWRPGEKSRWRVAYCRVLVPRWREGGCIIAQILVLVGMFSVFVTGRISLAVLVIVIVVVCVGVVPVKLKSFVSCKVVGSGEGNGEGRGKVKKSQPGRKRHGCSHNFLGSQVKG